MGIAPGGPVVEDDSDLDSSRQKRGSLTSSPQAPRIAYLQEEVYGEKVANRQVTDVARLAQPEIRKTNLRR